LGFQGKSLPIANQALTLIDAQSHEKRVLWL
jgi:hypothetical protein